MIQITDHSIDTMQLLQTVASKEAGAVVLFVGTAREVTGGRRTTSLDYEAYDEMAKKLLRAVEADARSRWPIVGCGIIHRVGHVRLGEASVAVAVSTAHRQEAFQAAHWIIDRLKQVVPIWKRENWADGSSEWVHPNGTSEPAPGDRPAS